MLFKNIHFPGQDILRDILTHQDKIVGVGQGLPAAKNEPIVEFSNAIAFPGLINSHDHLEFNLFPRLGHRIYSNYAEWGEDIHIKHEPLIRAINNIPLDLRARWGEYKNLLNGVTTVVNHGKKLPVGDNLIGVVQTVQSLHSLRGERNWRYHVNLPHKKYKALVMHVGEGSDPVSRREIDRLINWNLLNRKLVGVHGIAMSERQAASFSALVWCPDSNIFLYNKTADVDLLRQRTNILFGTDSTLTSSWNIWEQIRLARQQQLLDDRQLFESLTTTPAETWELKELGSLGKGKQADLVIAKTKNYPGDWDSFYGLNPEDILLVLREGDIKLFADEIAGTLLKCGLELNGYYKVNVMGCEKHVKGNLPALRAEIDAASTIPLPSLQFPPLNKQALFPV